MTQALTGGCLCGAIRYTVNTSLRDISACHCTHCRKISGAGSSHNAIVPTDKVSFTAGQPKRYVDTADSGSKLYRFFCPDCGSSLYSQREKMPEVMVLKVGTLDDASGLRITRNIWCGSALPWMHIDPAVEKFPANRPV